MMMRLSNCCMWASLFLLVGLCAAQGPAPAPDCSAELINLLPCLDYVQGNVSAPPQNCCLGLGNVVKADAVCLCTLFNSSALPIQVNTTRALLLPGLCGVSTPKPVICGGVAVTPVQVPVPSPAATPAASTTAPATSPATGTAPVTPPVAATTSPKSAPVMAPAVAPATPASTPSLTPTVAPVVPAPTPAPTPEMLPPGPALPPADIILAPSAPAPITPLVSSPPAPPPAASNVSHAPTFAASTLLSAVAVLVSGILFLQL